MRAESIISAIIGGSHAASVALPALKRLIVAKTACWEPR
jgi:hypothetical protein